MERTIMNARTMLVLLIRMTAVAMLCGLVFVFCPFEWMAEIHSRIGMGTLEYTPLLSYLTRSLSAMYAIVGASLMLVSFNIERYRPFLTLFGWIAILGGIGVTYLDAILKLPAFWTWMEGPLTILLGIAILFLLPRIEK
ncbi:MAG: hypothetical protein JW828_03290 [Sedimentisphaerales bacterium]|nr:hypothetical protein [Sedimentisphaerales bacterium]